MTPIAMGHSMFPMEPGDEQRPNIVIFYLDDIGTEFYGLFDSLNAYGPGVDPFADGIYVQTPVLDSLAASGVTFTNAYATPLCSPGRASLLTGLSQERTGIGTLIRPDFIGELAEFGDPGFERKTLADLTHMVGGEAGIIGKWHLNLPTPAMNPEVGSPDFCGWRCIKSRGHWDDVRCTFGNLNSPQLSNGQPGGYYNFDWFDNGHLTLQTGNYATSLQMTEALDFCQNAREPFLAYVSPNAVHFPLGDLPPAGLVNTPEYLQAPNTLVKNCQAALEAMDTEIGRFLAGLDPERRERTLVIVMGDNGTDTPVMRSLLQEYGPLGQIYNNLINSPFSRFKHSLYEGGIRVPMVVSWSGVENPGRISEALVHVSDIFPTVARAWSLDPGSVDGVSFLPLLTDATQDSGTHERQDLRVDFFQNNGRMEDAQKHRGVIYSRRFVDGRRFKLLREYGLPNHGGIHDRFYLLADENGGNSDPYELNPLNLEVGAAYWDEYLVCAEIIAPEQVWSYCGSSPNGSGAPALMSSSGPASVSANSLTLEAGPMLASTLGFFQYSSRAAEVPFSNGAPCLGSSGFGPYFLPFARSNPSGQLSHAPDLDSPPIPEATICPGSTWRFQAVFRDSIDSQSSFARSDGLAIRWAP